MFPPSGENLTTNQKEQERQRESFNIKTNSRAPKTSRNMFLTAVVISSKVC